jgi:hypothetical protein
MAARLAGDACVLLLALDWFHHGLDASETRVSCNILEKHIVLVADL